MQTKTISFLALAGALLIAAAVYIFWPPLPPPPPPPALVSCPQAQQPCMVDVLLVFAPGSCYTVSSSLEVTAATKIRWRLLNPQGPDGTYKFDRSDGVKILNMGSFPVVPNSPVGSFTLEDDFQGPSGPTAPQGTVMFKIGSSATQCVPISGVNPYVKNRGS